MSWSRIPMIVAAVLGALLLGAVAIADLSPGVSFESDRLRAELDRVEGVNAAIRARNEQLGRRLQALRNNRDLLEHAAREDLGFIRDGEVVVVLPK